MDATFVAFTLLVLIHKGTDLNILDLFKKIFARAAHGANIIIRQVLKSNTALGLRVIFVAADCTTIYIHWKASFIILSTLVITRGN